MIGLKGFAFEADDIEGGDISCRDVRGFSALLAGRKHAELMLVIPSIEMSDWVARWADDTAHARRRLKITRRTDGKTVTVRASLATFGYGVQTVLAVDVVREPMAPGAGASRRDDSRRSAG